MSEQVLVQLSLDFKAGKLNNDMFKDIPYMNDDELKCLFQFLKDVESCKLLIGKNKPSWKNDDKSEIPGSGAYKEGKHWHYHCGPYQVDTKKSYKEVQYLEMNIQGKPSKAVIHYQKISKNHIFIVGYSPNHIPFPSAAALLNPILQRSK